MQDAPRWLAVEALLARFGRSRALARERYAHFVAQGMKAQSPSDNLKGQIYLGDERFVERMQRKLDRHTDDINIPLAQRRGPAPSLAHIQRAHRDRDQAMLKEHGAI